MGFSWFIALGDSLDIDVDELLDYLARDSKTSAILLYLEHLSDARRFVSAARSASRNKPILVIKSGRSPAAQRLLHTSAGMDPASNAAIQRAGLLRVQDTHELFSAVETLSHMRPLRGDRLMIISNGAAPAALALDELWSKNGKLATLSEDPARNYAMRYLNILISPTRWICVMTPAANTTLRRWISCWPAGFRRTDGDSLTQRSRPGNRKRASVNRGGKTSSPR